MEQIDIAELEQKTDEEIENIRVEKLNELNTRQDYAALIKEEILKIQFNIIDLQKKKKELEISYEKAAQVVRQLNIQIKILTSKFWSARNR